MSKKYELSELTPKKTVEELDRYIIGQGEAKKAVAVALRNRYRRSRLTEEQREEITPKNIILMGPTGVGKTEITRRIAKLVNAPLVKVEATKFTEVGYVGRDVESMVRDLAAVAIRKAEQEKIAQVQPKAEAAANEILVDLISGIRKKEKKQAALPFNIFGQKATPQPAETEEERAQREKRIEEKKQKREQIREDLLAGRLEEEPIIVEVKDTPTANIGMMNGMEDMNINIGEMFGGMLPEKTKKRRMKVSEARRLLTDQEAQKMIDRDEVTEIGLKNAEQNGIIFIDEIDKIIGNSAGTQGPDVSREGVQRDILPIVEGSTVNTKFGPLKTDFILFIGSGAFHGTKVSDMIPELQGRFPVDVALDSLTRENFEDILTKTENSVLYQYRDLLATEGVHITYSEDAVKRMAEIAWQENLDAEDIGARRLHTVLEKLLEEISYEAPDIENKDITIDRAYVDKVFEKDIESHDYKKYLI